MKDRSYIVTHAAQPVARDIARALAERGARVYALAFPGEGEIPFGIPCRADGYGPGEIGRALDISPRTVEIYRAKLMAKTQAENLQELVRWSVLAGLAYWFSASR